MAALPLVAILSVRAEMAAISPVLATAAAVLATYLATAVKDKNRVRRVAVDAAILSEDMWAALVLGLKAAVLMITHRSAPLLRVLIGLGLVAVAEVVTTPVLATALMAVAAAVAL
jgi:hypothetical protein